MEKKSGFDPIWFTLGCLIGFAGAALLIVGLKIYVNFAILKNYQDIISSLTGSILALVAAALTIRVMQKQIQQTADLENERVDLENERQERRDYATRAVLPHMLASISQYAEDCFRSLLILYEYNADALGERWSAPEGLDAKIQELPIEVVTALRENIEITSDLSARENMRWLLHKWQVQRSKFGKYLSGIVTQNTEATSLWEMHVWDALEIYALSSSLFGYARHEKEPLNYELLLPLDAYTNAARICCRIKPSMCKRIENLVTQEWNQRHK